MTTVGRLRHSLGDCTNMIQPSSIIEITAKDKIPATAREACGGKSKWQQTHLPKEMGSLFTTKLVPYAREHLLGAVANPWVPPTVQEIQNAVDTVFGKDQFEVAGKGVIAGLLSYRLTDVHHSFAIVAVKCTEEFFEDYSDELSSPEL
ncbi:hypothetical protein ARMSODRAFT_1013590 [Armillaria solidipes]|uniref:Uncharacterized protein n=1 Tax=Armillaria solidipes TaxID=1076256 RepID=A0A2H3C5S2_9AGAR|nr:hypothetical protein ARMSODRAFT_1013590 [Armillaria solidipes]